METWTTACVLVLTLIQTAVAEVRVCRLDADCRQNEYCTGVTTRSDGYCVPNVGARPCVRDRDCPVDEICSFQGQLQQGFCTQRLNAIPPQYDPVVVGYPFGSLQRCFGDDNRGDRSGCPPWEYCSDQTGRTEGYCLGQDCYSNSDCEGVTCNGGAVNPRLRGYCSLPQVVRTQLNVEPQPDQPVAVQPIREEPGRTPAGGLAPKDAEYSADGKSEAELTGEEAGEGLDISPRFKLQFLTEAPRASQDSS
ncbi:hypothetical protein Bbelb_023840 [Branchiostoma belcheri]|nr:hypothetical protein Bbelb_023840 [Branchiostoma belcheri]